MEDWKSWDDLPDIEPDFEFYEGLLKQLGIELVTWAHQPDFCPVCRGYKSAAEWDLHADG